MKTSETKFLTEKSTVITSEEKQRKTFNGFFVNAVPDLNINAYKVNEVMVSEANFVASIIVKYIYHVSIKAIKTMILCLKGNPKKFHLLLSPFVDKDFEILKYSRF